MQVVKYEPGDIVRILTDEAKVKALQYGHGGWIEIMSLVHFCREGSSKNLRLK